MLTSQKETKDLTYITQLATSEMLTTVYSQTQIFTRDTITKVFASPTVKVEGKEIDFVSLLKKQKLLVGIV